MAEVLTCPHRRRRAAIVLASPRLWPAWPYLPLVRRAPGGEALGVAFDFLGLCGLTGFSSAVFLVNLFEAPADPRLLFALPREVYDSPEEVAAAGWDID